MHKHSIKGTFNVDFTFTDIPSSIENLCNLGVAYLITCQSIKDQISRASILIDGLA